MSHSLKEAVKALENVKLSQILIYDFRGYSPLFDYVVLATGTSERQVLASIHHLREAFAKSETFKVEGSEEGRWVLVDTGDILINVMHKDERIYYGLEKLFIERPQIDVEKL